MTTVPDRLEQMGLRHLYTIYKKGSMAIHGSSFDQFFIELAGKSWVPRTVAFDNHWREVAMQIAGDLEDVYVRLMKTKSTVWQ